MAYVVMACVEWDGFPNYIGLDTNPMSLIAVSSARYHSYRATEFRSHPTNPNFRRKGELADDYLENG